MPNIIENLTGLFFKLTDRGGDRQYSIVEMRYMRATSIACILGALYQFIWMVMALYLAYSPIMYGSNIFLGGMFVTALILNKNARRILAAVWLSLTSYLSVFFFVYLLGYSSGVAIAYFLVIILPYITFPRKARRLAHAFSFLGCFSLIFTVWFQSSFVAHYTGMNPYFSQVVNISITAIICLLLLWSLSVLLDRSEDALFAEQKKADDLLHNILPAHIVKDLKENGKTVPRRHKNVSVLFTDFEGFTDLVSHISEITLVQELNDIFGRFDEIMEENNIEKIETIGDAYMAAAGLTAEDTEHAVHCIAAAQKMLIYLDERNKTHEIVWKMRVGIHSGSIVAGVVGKKKFAYDLFGDTINTASRMESAGAAGKINISSTTYQLVKHNFTVIPRGKVFAKGKGDLEMYFIK